MQYPFPRVLPAVGLFVGLVACAGGPRPVTQPDAVPSAAGRASATGHALPPIPHVSGPVAITVVYPRAGALIMSRDSNFVLGSVGTGDATLTINGFNVAVRPNGAFLAWLPVPDSASSRYDLVAAAGTDTIRVSHPIRLLPPRRMPDDSAADTLAVLPSAFPDSGRFVTLAPADTTVPDTDRIVIVRPVPHGTYRWFLLPGTVVRVTGRGPGSERIRLDDALDGWVSLADVRLTPVPPSAPPPHRVVGAVRVVPGREWVDLGLTIGERPPFLVEENGNDLILTLYDTQASTDVIHYVGRLDGPAGPPDTLVRSITWAQETNDRARYTIHLSAAPYGYLVLWTSGGLVLRIRRAPLVDPAAPLRGLTIAVDAGHPPQGATGPTGLYEPVPTLAVAQRVESLLVARGATVVMTRTSPEPMGLTVRPVIARRANAQALVSIHLNALPDGTNPYTSFGTGTYYFHPHSVGLARAVQTGMVGRIGLPDLGVHYDNLALVRPTWMPAVLCEGAFIIIPEQEAALRTPAFQDAYAQGVVAGLEAFFRGLASATATTESGVAPPTASPPAPPPAVAQ
jgi:N-acetylmuramoyl-L-alanine amidase